MEGRHSGVEEYTLKIIDAMTKVAPRHSYHLFANSYKQAPLPQFAANVVVHRLRYPNKIFNLVQLLSSRPRWDRLVGADVFFVPNSRLTPLSPVMPLVTTVHDLSFERFPEFLDTRRRVWHRLMRPRLLLKNSDAIIAVSEHTKQDIIDLYGIDPAKITTVYSGISAPAENTRPARIYEVRKKLGLPDKYVLYFGALEPRKNIPCIIQAFEAIADRIPQDLVIAGESGWKTKLLNRAINDSSRKDRIKLIGFVNESDKAALYAAADFFVYPSFYEGFGFPPLEALAGGTPVITSFNSALPEVVGEWANLIDPYNPSQLAAVMLELAHENKRVPAQVQKTVRDKYSWDETARQTIKVIEGIS